MKQYVPFDLARELHQLNCVSFSGIVYGTTDLHDNTVRLCLETDVVHMVHPAYSFADFTMNHAASIINAQNIHSTDEYTWNDVSCYRFELVASPDWIKTIRGTLIIRQLRIETERSRTTEK